MLSTQKRLSNWLNNVYLNPPETEEWTECEGCGEPRLVGDYCDHCEDDARIEEHHYRMLYGRPDKWY